MDAIDAMLLHLLDCSLRCVAPEPARAVGVDWEALFAQAQAHKIDAMLLDTVCSLPEDCLPPSHTLAAWQENALMTTMGQALMVAQLHDLLDKLENEGIRAVALKGVSLKALYPQPDLRTMSDADLLVAESAFEGARRVMETEGFAVVDREPFVDVLRGPDGLRVELHARLFDRTAYGFLSKLDERVLFPLEIVSREPVYGGTAWVFPPLEHALFMLCHMAKHMITTGFGLRQTVDYILFVRANDEVIHWPLFWRRVGDLGLTGFASALLCVGIEHLSLKPGRFAWGMLDDKPAARGLLLDLLDAGVFGNRTEERRRSAAVVYRAFEAADADAGRIRRALFPSAATLKAPYLYARRIPFLLPFAWLHRLINYALHVLTGRAKHADTAASIQIADERLLLLSRLGLRENE